MAQIQVRDGRFTGLIRESRCSSQERIGLLTIGAPGGRGEGNPLQGLLAAQG